MARTSLPALAFGLLVLVGPGPQAATSLQDFLRQQLRLTPAQVAAVERGEAVAVDVPSSLAREIVVGGVVRIEAPADRLVALVRDIERLESGAGFLRTKKISEPPVLEDFSTLVLPASDIADLEKCRPGKCDVKLGQGAFDVLKTIDWKAPDHVAQANTLARQMALDYVSAYRKGGNQELAIYRDRANPQFIAQEFDEMVKRVLDLPHPLPALATYLVEYPGGPRPPGAEDFFYWSLAQFGLKPVVRINHVAIFPGEAGGHTRHVIATKQLYASHYFHTALELRAVVDDSDRPGRAHYLFALNAARSDGLTGAFGSLVKAKARSGSREGLQKALAGTKAIVEAQ
jgi:hypothetical protein